ncbi:hypothetical protein EMIHUDRAFT_449012 [Emiliania huxleyi CCMP1516]|uniref:Uncharacterized protein n=2 Tax=Emiliania huxleyi TaxID=2903 RepID=A0A0D3KQV5_EMIH1|nr:hypothetical protein EMIHUDRAFT_449012 [Emiliania huxleyi CCMP1516]EOD38140.1 hypothetical protein EMIHUDRAFT_449012 [Emiliania huxleyi CCMP1516]|eukprot:XP_005790569.1 hypothetical protein EMIHUDRAFT_449012 [Emiliania huxleyi CCMP1516]
MDRWSFILGVAVAVILRKVVDVLGEPYHVASSIQVGEPKWVQPIKRLMDGGHEANRQLAVGDVLSAVAAQQLHHAHTLANALSASIEAPLALRSAVVGLGVRVLLALAAVWSMAPIARAGVRRLSRPRPAMRSWLAQVEQRLLGSPWLGCLVTGLILAAAVAVIVQAAPPPPPSPPAAAEWHERATHPSAVRPPQEGACAASRARGPVWRGAAVGSAFWRRLVGAKADGCCGSEGCAAPDGSGDEAGLPLLSALTRLLGGGYRRLAAALRQLRPALCCLGVQASLASLLLLAMRLRQRLQQRDSSNYAKRGAALVDAREPEPVNLESKILDLADQSRRRRMAGLYGLRRLGAAAQLLLCLSVGRTCWLLLSLALVRDDATETSFVDAMTFTSIAPRVERLLSAATRGLAIFPPGYVFWYAAALELLNCRGPRLAQMALLGTGLGVSQVLGSATSLAPSAATAALWRGWAEQARALVPLVALLQSAGSFDAPPPRCLLLLAAPDVTARNASLRGLDSLLRLKRMHSRVRAAASKASESASLNFLARLLGEGGPIHTALLTSGGSPLPSELLPVARLLLDHSHRVANEPRIGSAVAQLWPMGGSLLASLLHDVFLSQHGRWMLRRGLCALQAQEEEMAPPDEVRFPRELLHGLKKWTLMPAVGVRGCVVAHDDLKADSAVPASRIFSMRDDPRTGQPLPWTPVIRVAARCYTTLGKDGQPVRLVLDTKNLVRIRRVGYFTEASLFNARVTAAGLAVRAAERTESAARVLLAKDDAEQEAEFNFITLIDLPVPPWRMPLHVWMRGMQVDLTMVGSARQGEKLLSLEWEAASPEDEARGRVGSVIICLDRLNGEVRLPEIGLRLLGTERHKDLRAKGRNGKIVARLRLAIEKGGALAPAGTQPAALGPGLYLTASSTVKGGTRTGLVRLAASASGLISAFTPEWMANKLWRPVLTSIEEAIVENNQSNPVLLVQELHLLADVATYLQRAMRRQADRETALEQSLKVKYARRLLARAKALMSLAAVASSSRATAARLRPRRSLGGALSDSSGAVLQARPQRHRSLEEGGRASLSDGWQSRRSILRASQAAAAGWRRVYVVLGGGRLREYRNLQAARDDIVSRLAQRGSDVRAARVGREWCLELDVQGLMKALERKTYACETQEGRRRWADCARLEARTPARLSLESAIGQAGHSITSAFSHLRLPLGLRRAHVAPFEEGAATPTRTPPSPVFLSACSHAAAPRGGSRPASPAADPAAEPSEGQARASTASSAPRRLAGACSSATGTEWCKPLPLPPSLAALEPAQRLSGRSPSSPRWQRLAQAKLEEIGKEISKTSEEIGKAAQAKLDEIGKAAGSSQRKAQERVSALVHFAQEQEIPEASRRVPPPLARTLHFSVE